MKILLMDLETGPNTAYVWGIWNENIPLTRLKETSKLLCWTAKWLGEDEIYFDSIHKSKPKAMLRRIHKLLDAADVVVTYNGNRFDIPVLNREFLLNGLPPPSPTKSIDLYKITKSKFRFVSNKLTHVCKQLGLGEKIETDFQLWVRCMDKDADAWAEMEEYNINDVILLERLYERLLPWSKGQNHSVHTGTLVCPACGGSHIQHRGRAVLQTGIYPRLQCQDCGHWFRSNKSIKQENTEKYITL
jgi:ribosomal protein L32